MKAKLKFDGGFITHPAQGIGDNPGSSIEVVVPKDSVEIISFSKY